MTHVILIADEVVDFPAVIHVLNNQEEPITSLTIITKGDPNRFFQLDSEFPTGYPYFYETVIDQDTPIGNIINAVSQRLAGDILVLDSIPPLDIVNKLKLHLGAEHEEKEEG